VSILWFLFAFALSIEGAFGHLGENATAHDLALGCLLAWFPILIMGSIVDRNPIAAEAIRKKLNALVDHVRHALQNERRRNEFIETFQSHPEVESFKKRVINVADAVDDREEFFGEFAGYVCFGYEVGEMPQRNSLTLSVYVRLTVFSMKPPE
jgi:hypothetical protein